MFFKVKKQDLIELLTDQHILNCLERDGVDNWSWYMEGKEDYLMEGGATKEEIDTGYDFSDLAELEIEERFELIEQEVF